MFKVQSSEANLAILYIVNFYVRVSPMGAGASFRPVVMRSCHLQPLKLEVLYPHL